MIQFDSGIIGDIGSKMPCAHRWDTTDFGATLDIEPKTRGATGEDGPESLAGMGFAAALLGAGVVICDDLRFQADNAYGDLGNEGGKSAESRLTGSKMRLPHRVDTSRCDPRETVMERVEMARCYADIGKVHDSLEMLADAIESMVLNQEECT